MNRSRIDALIARQERLRTLTRADIETMQLKKLNELLRRERARGGFYRALPARVESLGALAALPFTTARELAENAPGLLLTSQGAVQRVVTDLTSGTTGAAKRMFYTEGDCENTVQLFMAGLGELIFPGSVTMICMPFSGPHGLGELIAEAVQRLGARALRLGAGLSYAAYRDVLTHQRPDTFVGMPAQLLSLLRVCGRGSLRRALVSGDACPASVSAGCERILETRLFPHYGSRELGLGGAITCPAHMGMHLRENHVIAEIVAPDGRVLPHGAWGELVITTIGMEALPLIRYRTGDRTRILPGKCPCGSEVLRLDAVTRRAEADMLALDELLFSFDGVADHCAALRGGVLQISLRTCGAFDAARAEARLRALFPGRAIRLAAAPVQPDDAAFYAGKRRVL